jgi:hypothetical protein
MPKFTPSNDSRLFQLPNIGADVSRGQEDRDEKSLERDPWLQVFGSKGSDYGETESMGQQIGRNRVSKT